MLVLLATLLPLALAAPHHHAASSPSVAKRWLPGYDTSRVGPANADCTRSEYQISVSSMNTVFQGVDSYANETVLTSLFQLYTSSLPSSTNFTDAYEQAGKQQVNGTYAISGTICYPKGGNKVDGAIQLLVHGIGFDASYWDFALDGGDEYSYVAAAADAGYTSFRFDRLGTGNSEHPQDAYNVVQAATDLAITQSIASMVRNGGIDGTSYTKIVGIGHSYGAVQMEALTATVPDALDAVILQGFSANTSFVAEYLTSTAYETATQIFPQRFPDASELSNAYLVTATPSTNQLNFFWYPGYSADAFNLARATEQPVTQGVLFTFGSLVQPATTFNKPVLVATGDHDWIFCGNNCYATPAGSTAASILDYVKTMLYPAVTNFSTYIPANTGHAVNQHYSAPETYAAMTKWIQANL